MNLIKNIVKSAAITAMMLIPVGMQAQFKLPDSHNKQHSELIAHQRPVGVDLNTLKLNSLNESREMLVDDSDLFNYNWESQSIASAYAGLVVPETKNIDVTGYVPPVKGALTSGYGYRPRFGRMHKGVDLNLNTGDTIVAAFDGKVRIAKFEGKGYGYYIVIRHDNGLETVYGHMSRFIARPDQYVRAGEPIGLGGSTGRSTGPHLHFETRYMGIAINPEAIIDFENYVTHKDVFCFNKTTCEKSQQYGPAKKRSKSTASKKKKRRRR